MDYDSRFLDYLTKITQVDMEACVALAMEAYEESITYERYRDAALMIMLVCRRLRSHESQAELISTLSLRNSWKALLQVNFFFAWLADSQLATAAEPKPKLRYDDRESRWIDTQDNSEEGLLSTCRVVFSDLQTELGHHEGHDFGGVNLLFFLNRSRRSHGSSALKKSISNLLG